MLEALSVILGFQLMGEALSQGLNLPIPGPVIGLCGLFILWPFLGRMHSRLENLSASILSNLGLMFVPAGVGISLHLGLIAAWWAPLLLALSCSLAATAAGVAWVFGAFKPSNQAPGET